MVIGQTLEEAGTEEAWIEGNAVITKRDERDRKVRHSHFQFGPGIVILAMDYRVFKHIDYPLRKAPAQHPSMQSVASKKAKYINCSGYWIAFYIAVLALCPE